MPLAKATLSLKLPQKTKDELVSAIAGIVVKATGKPESYMMVSLGEADIAMAGQTGPAACVEIQGIGEFTRDVNSSITRDICRLLQDKAKLDPKRIYVTFTSVAADHWGWNGATFA